MDYLRKAVSLGSNGAVAPGYSQPQDFRFQSGQYPSEVDAHIWHGYTKTPWVKIWLYPASFWPSDPANPANAGTLNTTFQGAIDEALGWAHIWGYKTILSVLPWWPQWINASTNTHNQPQDISAGGKWAYFIYYLAGRYNALNANRPYGGYGYTDVMEVFNEPNNANQCLWPGVSSIPTRVADMMKVVKQNLTYTGNNPVLAGPAVLDTPDYLNFTNGVLSRLSANGFYTLGNNQSFIWTVHNYGDVKYHDLPTRTSVVYDRLVANGWRGWPDGGTNPVLFSTEGGSRTVDIPDENTRAVRIEDNWYAMKDPTKGRGVGLVTNYLWVQDTQAQFDAALRAQTQTSPFRTTERNAYFMWSNFASAV